MSDTTQLAAYGSAAGGIAILIASTQLARLRGVAVAIVGLLFVASGVVLNEKANQRPVGLRRAVAISTPFLSLAGMIAGVRLLAAQGPIVQLGVVVIGLSIVYVGYWWNKSILSSMDRVLGDERTEQINQRAAHHSWRLTMILTLGLLVAVTYLRISVTPSVIAQILLFAGILSRIGFLEYYKRAI